MFNRRERFIAIKRWVKQLCPSFSPWRIGSGLSNLGLSSRNLALFIALMVGGSSGFAQIANVTPTETATASIEGVVAITDQQGQADAVPGVLVKLTGPSSAPGPLSSSTDAEGRYRFTKLPSGSYTIETSLEGFKPVVETVVLLPGDAKTQNVSLELEKVIQKIEVRDKAAAVSTETTDSTAKISSRQFTTLPLAEQKFTAVLPLVPGVVRTRDGTLNFKGVSENQGMLLVDSAQTVDPVTGSFSIPIPLDTIQTLNVDKTPYNSEYGGFAGGLTTIGTKPPSGDWHYGVMDFLPGFRGKGGHLVGVSAFSPRVYFGGPVVKNKLNFSEAFTYDLHRSPVRGLAWPYNETKRQGFNTLTSFQAVLSPRHLLSVSVNGFSNRHQFADITALVPQTASSDKGWKGASVGATDSYQFSSGALLSTMFRYTRFDSNAHGQGSTDMVITPEGWGGNSFNAWTRTSNQFELMPVYTFPLKEWRGRHELKVGADLNHRSYHGTSQSHPIQLLREDGSLAERLDFQGEGRLQAQDTEMAEFVQDHWMLNDRLALDLGGRLSSQSIGRSAAFAPRAGVAYSPGNDRKTIIRAGAGLFYDRVPLLASDFRDNPTRVASFYDEAGSLVQSPLVFQNAYVARVSGGGFVPVGRNLDTSPRNFTGSLEVDRELRRGMIIRASYLYSQTQDLFFVTPAQGVSGGISLLGLANTGGSHYHEIEATLHYRAGERSELNVSYVRSHGRGDLNTLSDVYVPLEQPVIRPNVTSNFAADIPNRVVSWGAFPLPGKWTLSPVVDVHSGLPYSQLDTLQNYVGRPNSQNFPAFFSLDLKVYREFKIGSLPLTGWLGNGMKERKIRFGVYSLNLTDHSNPLEVYNNAASPFFDHFVGFQHRVNGFVIDVVN
jgi:Carboxypeptidase regulatory-like domain